jgi:hypothetical protein
MKSPFPGMDPYLEEHWLDVHTKLVAYCADALNGGLPDELIARTEERIAIESDGEDFGSVIPDVSLFAYGKIERLADQEGMGGTAVLAPYRLSALVEPITERFIEIIDVDGRRLVTVIEFVSPTNKRGRGLEEFVAKRDELLEGGVNFVEIDLTRTGNWRKLLAPQRCPPAKAVSTYRATIRTPREPGVAYLQPIYLRHPLPVLRIPLRPKDSPFELALQPLLEEAYKNGRYERTIDYTQPPNPPLEPEAQAWANQLLKEAGRRET